MASFNVQGLDALIASMNLEAERIDRNGPDAVKAGAAVTLEATQKTVPVRNGDLRDHIRVKGPLYNYIDGHHAEVYPTGRNKYGERYETIGFVLEYGRSNMDARPWMRPAVENNEDAIGAAVAEVLMRD